MQAISADFNLSADPQREFGIEIDPRHADAESIRAMAEVEINRISTGIQDFDPRVQAAINRFQSIKQTRTIIEAARERGFRSINVNLIYGLLKQDAIGFGETLTTVLGLESDRTATLSYAHLPQMFNAQRKIAASDLPPSAAKLALFEQTVDVLKRGGYHYVGMDHFALSTTNWLSRNSKAACSAISRGTPPTPKAI